MRATCLYMWPVAPARWSASAYCWRRRRTRKPRTTWARRRRTARPGHVLALVAEYAPPPPNDEAFDLGGVTWRARVDPASSYPYFENEATGQTQWADPRAEASAEPERSSRSPRTRRRGGGRDRARNRRGRRRGGRRARGDRAVEVVEVAEAPAAAPEAAAPAEAPAPAPKKNTPTRDWARKPLFSITNSVEATG